jgi:hypothetical protein
MMLFTLAKRSLEHTGNGILFSQFRPQRVQRGFLTDHAADGAHRQLAHEVARDVYTRFKHRLGRVVGHRLGDCGHMGAREGAGPRASRGWGVSKSAVGGWETERTMLHEEFVRRRYPALGDGRTRSSGIEGPLQSS